MSIESHFAKEANSKKPRRFKDVASKLLNEREPEDPRHFKWEEEITNEDWMTAEELLQECNEEITERALRLLYYQFMLNPIYHHKSFEELIHGVRGSVEHYSENGPLHMVVIGEVLLKHLRRTKLEINDSEKSIFEKHQLVTINWYVDYRLSLLLLDHNLFGKIPQTTVDRIIHFIDKERKAKTSYYLSGLVLCKLLGIPYEPLSDEEWVNCISWFGGVKDGIDEIDEKFYRATILRILAAHKVELTDDGLVITDKPDQTLDISIPPRPIRKKK